MLFSIVQKVPGNLEFHLEFGREEVFIIIDALKNINLNLI